MSFTINNYTLADLKPVRFVYDYHTKHTLKHQLVSLQGGLTFCKHDALINYKDSALSKKNCLFLTDIKELSGVFTKTSHILTIGEISGSLFLHINGKYVTHLNGGLFLGGIGEKLFINVVPVGRSLSELRINKTHYIKIDNYYPYTARITNEAVGSSDDHTRLFKIEYSKGGLISFKTKTKEGHRFLSFGVDRVIRAVGLELNRTIVNPYHFKAEFKTNPVFEYNTMTESSEIKYFNELNSSKNKNNVNIKLERPKNTNFLISCPSLNVSDSDEVNVNIAMLKTNFTSTGTFFPSI